MSESDKKSQAAKERDYKTHKANFRNLIEEYGSYFFIKDENVATHKQHGGANTTVASAASKAVQFSLSQDESSEADYLGKFEAFIPELTHDNIQVFIDLFHFIGLRVINFNLLAIFRYFHHQKYL